MAKINHILHIEAIRALVSPPSGESLDFLVGVAPLFMNKDRSRCSWSSVQVFVATPAREIDIPEAHDSVSSVQSVHVKETRTLSLSFVPLVQAKVDVPCRMRELPPDDNIVLMRTLCDPCDVHVLPREVVHSAQPNQTNLILVLFDTLDHILRGHIMAVVIRSDAENVLPKPNTLDRSYPGPQVQKQKHTYI